TAQRRYGRRKSPMPASAPTTSAAKGPKATAAKTNGRKATEPSVFLVSGTLCRSATTASRAKPPTIQIEGNESASNIPAVVALIHRAQVQPQNSRLFRLILMKPLDLSPKRGIPSTRRQFPYVGGSSPCLSR